MNWGEYFASNFQVNYIPPQISEVKTLDAFWLSLISIPKTMIVGPVYFPGVMRHAYFSGELGSGHYAKIEFHTHGQLRTFECELDAKYRWVVVKGIASLTRNGQHLDRVTWLNEFAASFKKARST